MAKQGSHSQLRRLQRLNQAEVIRCWENVLLLDDRDADAMNHLGAYLISVNRGPTAWSAAEKQAAAERCIAGSRLVERALGIQPNRERAASYVFCLRPLLDMAPARAAEMGQYILNHPALFKESPDMPWVKVAQTMPVEAADDGYRAKLDLALSRAADDPDAVLILCPPGLTRDRAAKPYRKLLERHLDSGDPVVQFVVHRALGELLCWQERDPAGLQHFDKAIATMEAARARCKDGHRDSLTGIYQMKIEACRFLGDDEEAGRTALTGAKHFQAVRRFDRSVARLYDYLRDESPWPGPREAVAGHLRCVHGVAQTRATILRRVVPPLGEARRAAGETGRKTCSRHGRPEVHQGHEMDRAETDADGRHETEAVVYVE